MSYEENLETITLEAGSDLSAGQYRFVDIASDLQIDLVAVKGAKGIGVLQDKPAAAGRPGSVGISGVSKVEAGAAIAAGEQVISDITTGKAIPTDAADQYIMGTALQAATADEDIIAILLHNYQRSA